MKSQEVAFQKRKCAGGWPGMVNLKPEVNRERHPGDLRVLETAGGRSVKVLKQNKRLYNLTER